MTCRKSLHVFFTVYAVLPLKVKSTQLVHLVIGGFGGVFLAALFDLGLGNGSMETGPCYGQAMAPEGLAVGLGVPLGLPLTTEYPIMATGVLLCPGVRITQSPSSDEESDIQASVAALGWDVCGRFGNLHAGSPALCPVAPHLIHLLRALISLSLALRCSSVKLLLTNFPFPFPFPLPFALDLPFPLAFPKAFKAANSCC